MTTRSFILGMLILGMTAWGCKNEDSNPPDPDAGGDAGSDAGSDAGPWDGCIQGTFYIQNTLDLEQLLPHDCVDGDIKITDSGLATITLPNLTRIRGELYISENPVTLTSVSAPALTEAGAVIITNNATLVTVNLNAITTITTRLAVENTPPLSTVGLASLEHIGGNLQLCLAAAVTDLSWLGSLKTIDGDFFFGSPYNTCNGSISNFDGLSSLVTVGDEFFIHNNAALPYCEICTLLGRLTSAPQSIYVTENLDDDCYEDESLTADCPWVCGQNGAICCETSPKCNGTLSDVIVNSATSKCRCYETCTPSLCSNDWGWINAHTYCAETAAIAGGVCMAFEDETPSCDSDAGVCTTTSGDTDGRCVDNACRTQCTPVPSSCPPEKEYCNYLADEDDGSLIGGYCSRSPGYY